MRPLSTTMTSLAFVAGGCAGLLALVFLPEFSAQARPNWFTALVGLNFVVTGTCLWSMKPSALKILVAMWFTQTTTVLMLLIFGLGSGGTVSL